MIRRWSRMVAILVAMSGLMGADGPSVVVTQPDESKFPEITVYFEVKQPDGSFILDARRDEFRVAEDGQDRPILRFEAPESIEARPTTVVLVVDHSGSMEQEDRIGGMKRAVATFLEGLPSSSKVAVVAFSSEVELICPFTSDFGRVQASVDLLEAGGATRYYDAVSEALELLAEQTGRRAVLALTDGQDARSLSSNLRSAIKKAKELGLPVHTLGLGDENEIAVGALERLADETRGQHYLARDVDQLRAIYEEIARRLGSSYSLTYRTDRVVKDGTLRPIQISYAKAAQAAETAVFIRGMVVPAPGWSRLFLSLLAGLGLLATLPGILRHRTLGSASTTGSSVREG
ncbi:vWA domain-containing protein [Tundrisphaera lichenicola]|uniref:vWA domain-containing protein n=1 Tax=Tundrisphaera lichenicola TaxID=2029860 RepID=UPI003EBE96EE